MSIVKNGKYYFYDFVYEGKRYRRSCRTTDRKIAEQIEISVKNDIIKKNYSLPTDKNKHLLFQAAWENYLRNNGDSKGSIIRKVTASKHFLPFFGNKVLSAILPLDVKNYQLERKIEIMSLEKSKDKKESEINFRSVNYEIIIISNLFNFCMERGYADKNPAAKIKKLNELERNKILSGEDIRKLIGSATNKLTRDLISFLIYTGCRKGEALSLKWDDVDLKNGFISIKGTKTKYDRYIPVSKTLEAVLKGIEKNSDSPYVFNNSGRKIVDFKHSFKTACRNAGLKNLRIHDLRHVFGSKMVNDKTDIYVTSKLLGHKDIKMTMRYAHFNPETLKKAVEEVWDDAGENGVSKAEYEKAIEIIRKYERQGIEKS
ncbi:MAG: tyrosine-type recombinase/integrase [bacterium]